jgi:hypothetical protein
MSDISLNGLGSFVFFMGLMAVSTLAILIFAIVALVKNGKLQKLYSGYVLASLISFIVGLIGCIALEKMDLNLKTEKALDNWGTLLIILLSICISFLVGRQVWKKKSN